MATHNTISSCRQKLALIIGNNNYQRPESRLRHCINDADDLSASLKHLNFIVTTYHNLNNRDMVVHMQTFLKTIHNGDLVLFYFSGHGYQVGSENYLIPIDDNNIETEEDVESFAIPVERKIRQFADINPSYVTIFILDCCRVYWPKNTPKSRATVEGKGLHTMHPTAKGIFIQFACAANRTASDGLVSDRNGLFTKHLLRHIRNPSEDMAQIFQETAVGVYEESKGTQMPLSINGLMQRGRVYFNDIVAVSSEPDEKNSSSSSSFTCNKRKLLQHINEQKDNSTVVLCDINLIDKDMEIVCNHLLQNSTTLACLVLSKNEIETREILYLSNGLQNVKTLTYLSLENNHIGNEGMIYVKAILQNNEKLESLHLSNNEISDRGIKHLSIGLTNTRTLKELYLSHNKIGDKGMGYLSDTLQNNTTLTYLHLENNKIGDEGMQYLSSGLQYNNTLQELFLSDNLIGAQGIQYLHVLLQNHKTLTWFYLFNNNIGDEGMRYLSDGLLGNEKITYLYLCDSQIGDQGIKYLSDALQTKPLPEIKGPGPSKMEKQTSFLEGPSNW